MFRTILAAGIFALAASQPVFAQDAMKPEAMKPDAMKTDAMVKCDQAGIMKMQGDIDAMAGDAMKKDEATKAMGMAKDAMAANKADECAMHMGEAMKAMH